MIKVSVANFSILFLLPLMVRYQRNLYWISLRETEWNGVFGHKYKIFICFISKRIERRVPIL
jgi:hypothetical protein